MAVKLNFCCSPVEDRLTGVIKVVESLLGFFLVLKAEWFVEVLHADDDHLLLILLHLILTQLLCDLLTYCRLRNKIIVALINCVKGHIVA